MAYCYKVRVLEQTRLGDFSFMVASYGTTLLPLPLRQAKNIDSSKHLVKTHLFSKAFCEDFRYI